MSKLKPVAYIKSKVHQIKCDSVGFVFESVQPIVVKQENISYIFTTICISFEKKMSLNPFPNKSWFLLVCNRSLLKTLWEKEKLLVTSNFFFSHSVSYQSDELSAIFIKFEIVVC